MGSFGDKLQREREMRGITLEEIAAATKIGTRSLRALEEEDFAKLPGGIFNKGFVRAYARYLGINEEQAVTDYLAASGEPDNNTVLPALEAARRAAESRKAEYERLPSGDESRLRPLTTLVLLLAVVAAAGAGGWRLYPRMKERLAKRRAAAGWAQSSPPPAGMAPVTKAPAPPLPATPPPSPVTQAPAEKASAATETRPAAPGPATTLSPVSSTAAPAARPAAAPLSGVTAAVPSTVPEMVMLIRAREKSWLQIKADGKLVMKDTLLAGGETSVKAKQQIVLTAGNAGGIDVSFNGKPLPSIGENNQVATLVLTPSGVKRPRPAAASSPATTEPAPSSPATLPR